MIVGKDYIFYHVPKNAGTSIKDVLLRLGDGKKKGVHSSVRKSYYMMPEGFVKSAYKFAVVRNPYERVVSWYLHILRESREGLKKDNIIIPENFFDFVFYQRQIYKHKKMKDIGLFQTQLNYLSIDGKLGVDYLIRYENLQNDFDVVCRKLFNKQFKLPHYKNWGDRDWQKYYDVKTKNKVYQIFREDFKKFNYER